MTLSAALLACAIGVAPSTTQAIVNVESRGNPLALHVNHWNGPQPVAQTKLEAVALVHKFTKAGYNVDIGLGQINSRNLPALRLSIEDALEGCPNIHGSATILNHFYSQAVTQFGEGQRALKAALSGYNTGDLVRGLHNGYVARYTVGPLDQATVTAATVILKPWTDTAVYDREGYVLALDRPEAILEIK